MTERMIQMFGTADLAHKTFEKTSLADLKEAIYSQSASPAMQTRTYASIARKMGTGGSAMFSSVAEIAAAEDKKVLGLDQFGPKNLGILNESLIQIARSYGFNI